MVFTGNEILFLLFPILSGIVDILYRKVQIKKPQISGLKKSITCNVIKYVFPLQYNMRVIGFDVICWCYDIQTRNQTS